MSEEWRDMDYRTSIVTKDKRTTIRNETIRFRVSLNGLKSEFRAASCHDASRKGGAYNGISISLGKNRYKSSSFRRKWENNLVPQGFHRVIRVAVQLCGSFSDIDSAAKHAPASLSHLLPSHPSFPSSPSLPFRCPSLDRDRSSFYSASLNFP